MKRKVITIDETKCDGCGQCVPGCKEGALQVIDGKARLVSETYCDGLGACLGECPRGAISIEEREAPEFDPEAVERHLAQQRTYADAYAGGGCPGSAHRALHGAPRATAATASKAPASALGHWPVQLALVSPAAPFLRGADLLVCADCVPFAVPDFHSRYLAGRAVVVGCPKLDDLEFYREKLASIFAAAQPRSVTVLRMEVPCCGGIARAVVQARDVAQPELPIDVHVVGTDGRIVEQRLPAGEDR